MSRSLVLIGAVIATSAYGCTSSQATEPPASATQTDAASLLKGDATLAAEVPPPDVNVPRTTLLTTSPSSYVDVAPGRSPDAQFPAGTVFLATTQNVHGRGEPVAFEWDVARGQPLGDATVIASRKSDKQDLGNPRELRIAASSTSIVSLVSLDHASGGVQRLDSRSIEDVRAGADHPRSAYVPDVRHVSLVADERWVAMAYDTGVYGSMISMEMPTVGLAVFDASTLERVAAIRTRHQGRETNVRHDCLELVDGRLFAAELAPKGVEVIEYELPKLRVMHRATFPMPEGSKPGARVQLTRHRDHLFVLARDTLVELTLSLTEVARRTIATDEVAVGPAGQVLTTVGLEAAGRRGDYVTAAKASASCTPAWAGAFPLLACSVDMEGARVVRLAPR